MIMLSVPEHRSGQGCGGEVWGRILMALGATVGSIAFLGYDARRGLTETGVTFRTLSALSLRARGSYDGIGDKQFHVCCAAPRLGLLDPQVLT
jgi:hypothetical protein